MSLVIINNLRCEIGGKLLFESERLTVEARDIIGLIGKNGSGKTTLLKILSGEWIDFSGDIQINCSSYYSNFYGVEELFKSGGEINISKLLESFRKSVSLYLLDEPTTYLDKYNFNKVVRMIERSRSSFCIASHDRTFLDRVATKIWVIEQGKIKEYDCSFSDYSNERSFKLAQYENELKQYKNQKKQIKQTIQSMKEHRDQKKKKTKKLSASEYRLPGVKTKMGVKQKKLQKGISQQVAKLNQLKRPEQVEEIYDISFLTQFYSLPKRIIVIPSHESKIGEKRLWKISDLTLKSGDKLGIVGKNGAGKTTYLNYIFSVLPANYKVSYFRQNDFKKESKLRVYDVIAEATDCNLSESQIRTLLALLDFKRDKVFKIVGELSQGEKVKLSLLSILLTKSDVIILDEITNFLDLKTIEAVEKVLSFYHGILVFVSHDQTFIDSVATEILNIDYCRG